MKRFFAWFDQSPPSLQALILLLFMVAVLTLATAITYALILMFGMWLWAIIPAGLMYAAFYNMFLDIQLDIQKEKDFYHDHA